MINNKIFQSPSVPIGIGIIRAGFFTTKPTGQGTGLGLSLMPLKDWYAKTKKAEWRKFQEVKLTFNSADYIGNDRYVFNIGGNNYRIIAMIHFDIRTLNIRAILTHQEYNNLNKAGRLTGL